MQLDIFDIMYENYIIKNKIKIIEFFAGYGSQNLALKYLGANYEHHKICEWATKSIQAYNDLHIQDYTDYSKDFNYEEILDYLFQKGISINYNEPMTFEQIKRKGEKWCRNVYNNIIATNNLVNIQQVKAKDLEITDTEQFTYLLTYSFPCQDLSLAGNKKGMAKGSGTRSGMLWEVERILLECKELGCLPQCLVMENVTQIHSKENYPHMLDWIKTLESMGYSNYWQDLNAKDYGIPQNRDRTFMVSILGEYNYNFPNKIPLNFVLKDLLENNVDEKYYLSDKMIDCFLGKNMTSDFPRRDIFLRTLKNTNEKGISSTITCLAGQRPSDNFILIPEETKSMKKQLCNELIKSGIVKENDVINHSYTNGLNGKNPNSRQTLEDYIESTNGIMLTLCTGPDTLGIVVNDYVGTIDYAQSDTLIPTMERKVKIGNEISGSIIATGNQNGIIENNGEPICLNSKGGRGGIEGLQPSLQDRVYSSSSSSVTLTTGFHPSYTDKDGLRIRKLTPRECGRLMNVSDDDITKMSKNQSDSSLYHLFGDSICSNVLMAIFSNLLGITWEDKLFYKKKIIKE